MILYSFLLAIAAFTYSEVLTTPDMLFGKPYDFMERHLPTFLFKLLIGCSRCVAGQVSLWIFPFYIVEQYDVIIHIWFILQCIFNTAVIRALYYKIVPGEFERNKPVKKSFPTPPEIKKLHGEGENY